MIAPKPEARGERLAHRLGVTCAVFAVVGLIVGFVFALGVYAALVVKVLLTGWRFAWGLW